MFILKMIMFILKMIMFILKRIMFILKDDNVYTETLTLRRHGTGGGYVSVQEVYGNAPARVHAV